MMCAPLLKQVRQTRHPLPTGPPPTCPLSFFVGGSQTTNISRASFGTKVHIAHVKALSATVLILPIDLNVAAWAFIGQSI